LRAWLGGLSHCLAHGEKRGKKGKGGGFDVAAKGGGGRGESRFCTSGLDGKEKRGCCCVLESFRREGGKGGKKKG